MVLENPSCPWTHGQSEDRRRLHEIAVSIALMVTVLCRSWESTHPSSQGRITGGRPQSPCARAVTVQRVYKHHYLRQWATYSTSEQA